MNYRRILQEQFDARKHRNPNYSLRAFARFLRITPSRLSQLMGGRLGLSVRAAEELADRLELSEAEGRIFRESAAALHGRSRKTRDAANRRLDSLLSEQAFIPLPSELAERLHWYHFALLELLSWEEDPPLSTERLAARLGIEPARVEEAVTALTQLGLLSPESRKTTSLPVFRKSRVGSTPRSGRIPAHREMMEEALKRGWQNPRADIASVLLSIPEDQITEATEVLRKFREEFVLRFGGAKARAGSRMTLHGMTMQFFDLLDD